MHSKFRHIHPVHLFVFFLSVVPLMDVINYQTGMKIPEGFVGMVNLLSYLIVALMGFRLSRDFNTESAYLKGMLLFFLSYQILIILRGLPEDFGALKMYIKLNYVLWPALIPFTVFFKKDDDSIMFLLRTIFTLAVCFMAIALIDSPLIADRVTAETFLHPFVFPSSLLILNAIYLKSKVKWIAFLALVIGLIALTILARRNGVLSYGAVLLVSLYLLVRNTKAANLVKTIPFIVFIGCIGIVFQDQIADKVTSNLNKRMNEDTRTDVFKNFFTNMEGDLVFGRGLNGKYYYPIDDTEIEDGTKFDAVDYRDIIENGYLQLILKGGLLNVALFLLILVPAAILGIFFSKNAFTRSFGFIIFLWLMDMLAYGLPRLTLQYVLVWIGVGICFKKSLRETDDIYWNDKFVKFGLG